MRLYHGSSILDWALPLTTVPAGRAGHYAYENGPDTGGLQQLTKDPTGQCIHIANNRNVSPSLRARTLADGLYSAPQPIVGAPSFNGFAPLWTDSTLRLMGMVSQLIDPQHPNVMSSSTDWGQTVGLPIQYLTDVAINGPAIFVDNNWLIPCHYLDNGRIVCGVLRSRDGLAWTRVGPIALAGVDLVEPTALDVDGKVLMVMRQDNRQAPFCQTWLWPDGQQVLPNSVVPIAPATTRANGSPGYLAKTPDGRTLLIFAAQGPVWEFWEWANSTWTHLYDVAANESGVTTAYRYLAFQDGWLIAGEPDAPLQSAQQCFVYTEPLHVMELTATAVCPLTWPSYSKVTIDIDLTMIAQGPSVEPLLIVLGTATQSFIGWRFHDRGICPWTANLSWPSLIDMWPGVVKGLRMVIYPQSVEWWINDRLIRTEPYVMPTPTRLTAAVAPGAVWQISKQEIRA